MLPLTLVGQAVNKQPNNRQFQIRNRRWNIKKRVENPDTEHTGKGQQSYGFVRLNTGLFDFLWKHLHHFGMSASTTLCARN